MTGLFLCLFSCNEEENNFHDVSAYVNPFIGTAAHGHTYPGATLPFGMVQLSPDTGNKNWDWASGYHSSDSSIMGFSHTHLSGTGAADMGDILLMPMTGVPKFNPGTKENPDEGYRSRFSKSSELARPGYYSVILNDYNIKAELTTSLRVGFHQYTFNKGNNTWFIIDLGHGISNKNVESHLKIIDNNKVSGFRHSTGFVKDHLIYFYAEFSKPFKSYITYTDGNKGNNRTVGGKICKAALHFDTKEGEKILVKVGLSTVNEKGAMKNILAEIPDWNFEKIVKNAKETWENELSKVKVKSGDNDKKTIFYTALYHNLVSPNLISDVDGSYRGWDGKIHKSDKNFYTNYSLWDTYRATHPLYVLLYPDKDVQFINSMLERYKEIGELPINEYGINETFCMIGNHAIPVIADAFLKGVKGFDPELAYEAVKHSSVNNGYNYKVDWSKYMKYGYLPSDLVHVESVSRTLELTYDDWCVAQMAKKLGKIDDYRYFSRRAAFYKNLFDKNTSFMRGRNSDGSWVSPFDPIKVTHSETGVGDYTEANAWQYTWSVQHDVNGLIELMGGGKRFVTKLDSLFLLPSKVYGYCLDVSGLIGQYAQGNEPCQHIAYLFNYAGMPWKTQKIVHKIKTTLYFNSRDGLCGNDDCGQTSAWYVFGALGFYPVTPGADFYVIGTPSFSYVKLKLPNGNKFVIKAHNLSDNNYYIQSAKLKGKNYTKSYISYDDIKKGGIMEFTMGPGPQKKWGSKTKDCPVQRIIK